MKKLIVRLGYWYRYFKLTPHGRKLVKEMGIDPANLIKYGRI